MKRHCDEAYVLRTRELGESDLIVSLVGEQQGSVRGVARSARKSRRRFGGTLEPLTRVRVVWSEREGRELHRIESVECVRSFAAMQGDPLLLTVCAVMAELSEAFAREGEPDRKSFDLLGATLEALEGGAQPWVALRYFEYWMLRLHGVMAELRHCAQCGATLPSRVSPAYRIEVGLLCGGCADEAASRGRRLPLAARDFLERARGCSPAEMTDPDGISEPGGALEHLLRGSLESYAERKFRTYRHLRRIGPPTHRPGRNDG